MNAHGGHFQFQLKNNLPPGQIDESARLFLFFFRERLRERQSRVGEARSGAWEACDGMQRRHTRCTRVGARGVRAPAGDRCVREGGACAEAMAGSDAAGVCA